MSKPKKWTGKRVGLVLILSIIVIILSGFLPTSYRGWNWLIVISSMIVFIAVIGKNITGRASGIFINERNKMTLSRFQLAIWTLIVLSAFITIALERINANPTISEPLAIALPTELWALLGISTTSLVGSPLILSTKLPKKPAKEYLKSFSDAEKTVINQNVERFGTLASNTDSGKAEFADMFRGDEDANKDSIDMAKVQMFFFTIIIAFSYVVLLVNLIRTAQPADLISFPKLDQGLVALLGISSAGYLTSKTVDHTKTERK